MTLHPHVKKSANTEKLIFVLFFLLCVAEGRHGSYYEEGTKDFPHLHTLGTLYMKKSNHTFDYLSLLKGKRAFCYEIIGNQKKLSIRVF